VPNFAKNTAKDHNIEAFHEKSRQAWFFTEKALPFTKKKL
jgi:hypothetical protein